MPKIFISYRREDVPQVAHQLYAELIKHVPKEDVFIDVDSIQYGANFLASIERHVILADVVLVPIGPAWNGQPGERRLLDPNDFIRFELELALRHQKRVLPMLIGPLTRFPSPNDLPPSLATFHLINAFNFPLTLSQRELQQVVGFVQAQEAPQAAPAPTTPASTPLSSQPPASILPTPPPKSPASPKVQIFTYGQYRIVIPMSAYKLYENMWVFTVSYIIASLLSCLAGIFGAAILVFNFYNISAAYGGILLEEGIAFFVICSVVYGCIGLAGMKYRRQLLKIAEASPRGDERRLVRFHMKELKRKDKGKIFFWYEAYYKGPPQKR